MAIEDTEHSMTGTRPRQPDKYHGQRDFLLLGNWIFSVDQYFILTGMPVAKQGPFVSMLLRDEALLWYRSSYEQWDPATPLTWEIIRASMREYFAPPNEDRRLQDEWANLKQYDILRGVEIDDWGLTSGESARSLAQPAWRGGVLGCGFPKRK